MHTTYRFIVVVCFSLYTVRIHSWIALDFKVLLVLLLLLLWVPKHWAVERFHSFFFFFITHRYDLVFETYTRISWSYIVHVRFGFALVWFCCSCCVWKCIKCIENELYALDNQYEASLWTVRIVVLTQWMKGTEVLSFIFCVVYYCYSLL